ncbi:Abi family protein [Desulfovibrio sp. JC010]|uniref:Abi family protein n=1 Tax=Desulfovibrio sp. JC010 TaxID=2593641 RepID=UPI0013D3EE26|nr:Abi family protein [Desulfovibrio sp. JC010]
MLVYQDLYLNSADQIEHLKNLGLSINDRARAERYLNFISFHRLSQYFTPYQQSGKKEFLPGTSFDDVLKLYIFDRHLRQITMDGLERVEVAIRACIVHTMCEAFGSHWYMDRGVFKSSYDHARLIEDVKQATGFYDSRKRTKSCGHYFNTYSSPDLPPMWTVSECLSFGKWEYIYKGIADNSLRKKIAKQLNLSQHDLASWIKSLAYTRNCCAHYARLWNLKFTIKPAQIRRLRSVAGVTPGNGNTYYMQAIAIHDVLKSIVRHSHWADMLYQHIETCPLPIQEAGFPVDWHKESFWGL